MDDFFFEDLSNHADEPHVQACNDQNDVDMLGDENPPENPILNEENPCNNEDNVNKSLFGDDDDFDDNDEHKVNEEQSDATKNENTNEVISANGQSNNLDLINERKAKKQKIQEEMANERDVQKRRRQELQEEENKKMQVLMGNFSEEQLNRYEVFRRAAFTKSNIKKIIQTICSKTVSASVVIAMSGIAKVFVGEMVEASLDVKERTGEKGPIQPKHLREAYRLYKKNNKLASPCKHKKSPLF